LYVCDVRRNKRCTSLNFVLQGSNWSEVLSLKLQYVQWCTDMLSVSHIKMCHCQFSMADCLVTLHYPYLKLFFVFERLLVSDVTVFSITLHTLFLFASETLVLADVSWLVLNNKGCKSLLERC
jgi:hypothetical protein